MKSGLPFGDVRLYSPEISDPSLLSIIKHFCFQSPSTISIPNLKVKTVNVSRNILAPIRSHDFDKFPFTPFRVQLQKRSSTRSILIHDNNLKD
jgi:hypothetical protein